tara:strand:+ start:186 stop:404 length:219 start_codon:yes stop_codon:yes gene_type:complete
MQYHARVSTYPYRTLFMSQIDDAKATALQIQNGLARLGEGRTVALSVHKSKELIAELEAKTAQLVAQLESAG